MEQHSIYLMQNKLDMPEGAFFKDIAYAVVNDQRKLAIRDISVRKVQRAADNGHRESEDQILSKLVPLIVKEPRFTHDYFGGTGVKVVPKTGFKRGYLATLLQKKQGGKISRPARVYGVKNGRFSLLKGMAIRDETRHLLEIVPTICHGFFVIEGNSSNGGSMAKHCCKTTVHAPSSSVPHVRCSRTRAGETASTAPIDPRARPIQNGEDTGFGLYRESSDTRILKGGYFQEKGSKDGKPYQIKSWVETRVGQLKGAVFDDQPGQRLFTGAGFLTNDIHHYPVASMPSEWSMEPGGTLKARIEGCRQAKTAHDWVSRRWDPGGVTLVVRLAADVLRKALRSVLRSSLLRWQWLMLFRSVLHMQRLLLTFLGHFFLGLLQSWWGWQGRSLGGLQSELQTGV
ncbi:hypothetical protein BDR22DRAFT_913674 [Usnea florida]